ncbi:uncharacterized protein LOC113870194 [Abrus precatorius]|uniref:Uncharacterized protein LOC113870194 n=1 Tax=Abrus precatorius TaxID=3816 RepID=A0A8B8M232_ABRPR|nr:uncharacterized protein LOC113870194 [Abrus precatorius]
MTTLEITVVSAEGLNKYSSYFNRITPLFALTVLPTHMVHRYDGRGPTREHVFRVPVDSTFFSDTYSCLHLQLFIKRRFVGPTQLASCLIPASDIGLLPPDSVRFLSYRLRARDGSRSHVIVNLSIRLQGWASPPLDTCRTVIGIPVTAVRSWHR